MAEEKKSTLSLSRTADVKQKVNNFGGKVRQSFSHGKSKVVTVEVKRKRSIASSNSASAAGSANVYRSGNLTNEEVETRIKAVQEAIKEEKEQAERLRQEQEQKRLREEIRLEEEARNAKLAEEQARLVLEEKLSLVPAIEKEKVENEVVDIEKTEKTVVVKESKESAAPERQTLHSHKNLKNPSPHAAAATADEDDGHSQKSNVVKKSLVVKKDIRELKGKYSSGSGRVSIYNALDDEEGGRRRSLSSIKRAQQKNKFQHKSADEQKVVREVILPETLSVQELSNRMAVRTGEVVKALMKLGVMATANQIIDADTAELLIMDFGHKVKRVSESDVEIGIKLGDEQGNLVYRPPVVTIMGHVDHGKTSLLDALRKTDVALREAGGITQCIGAYQVTLKDGRRITFIDTPGHAAFTEMRSRGANVTDVVVLVVAADDSVKDQTIEAINHAKAAGAPIIVAINKVDKHGANPDNVRKDLLNHEVVVESYGGDVMDVEISAKTAFNLDKLEEIILLQAEMLELKANPRRSAEGVVIESRVEKGQGPVATILIQKGTLKVGDIFVAGSVFGRVKAIKNYRNETMGELTPGSPGEVVGFNGNTVPGDDFVVVGDENKAREISNYRDRKKRELSWVVSSRGSVEQMFSRLETDEKLQILSVIVKADVQGSSEAICSSLHKLSTNEVAVKVLHSGIGEITESDISLARASNALIIGFNVRANMQARDQIARDKLQVKYYSIIYDLIDDTKALLSGMLSPDIKENILGSAEVRRTFDVSKLGRIAGCIVHDGIIKRNAKARLIRNGIIVHSGDIKSVKRMKDDVKEVRAGFECGISIENYNDIHVKDIIECFELEEVARQL
ncbi:MAG: translation initiation factor IF-2 [Holosporaceae bacterium]|jgi:translation initiation factor IF-2|nr:translation initiation factor IF-2 [Holosporaceae bacterium]